MNNFCTDYSCREYIYVFNDMIGPGQTYEKLLVKQLSFWLHKDKYISLLRQLTDTVKHLIFGGS